jgi:hypothetical protein
MKKLITLLIIAIISFLAWENLNDKPQPQPQPTPISPEQEVKALLARSVIPSNELSELSKKYPDIVTRVFKGKRIKVSGLIDKALVSGVNADNLTIELAGSSGLKVMFKSDFKLIIRRLMPADNPNDREIRRKFHRERGSIFLTSYRVSKEDNRSEVKRLINIDEICREGDNITLRGEFRHIGSGWVKCDLLELP